MKANHHLLYTTFLVVMLAGMVMPLGSVFAQEATPNAEPTTIVATEEPIPTPIPTSVVQLPTQEPPEENTPTVFKQGLPLTGLLRRTTGKYYADYTGITQSNEKRHTGVDMTLAVGGCGAAVKAPADGWVILASQGWMTFVGWDVAIFHGYYPDTGYPYVTYYMHMKSTSVHVGQKVSRGDVIGKVGKAGSGCHLHWGAANKLPSQFKGYYEHASERRDGRGWVNPLDPPKKLIVTAPKGLKSPANDKKKEDPNPPTDKKKSTVVPDKGIPNSTPVPKLPAVPRTPPEWEKDVDRLADLARVVPGLKKFAQAWDKIKPLLKYLPYVIAGLIIGVVLYFKKYTIDLLAHTKWGRRRNRKKKEFFWLSVVLTFIYWYRFEHGFPDAVLFLGLLKYAFGIWVFFAVSGLIYRLWRHFHFDAKLEMILEQGGTDGWESVREAVLGPTLLVLILGSMLTFTVGYFMFGPGRVVDAAENPPAPISSPSPISSKTPVPKKKSTSEPTTNAPKPVTNGNGVEIQWDCDFNPIEAGLGPVKVGCDDNGMITFPIRWWNGNMFNFRIPMRVWKAMAGASDTPDQVIGLLAFGSSESTGWVNYPDENYAGAAGILQFLPGTFKHWAPAGYKDPKFRTSEAIAAMAARNMQEKGMKEIYLMRDKAKYISCFQGGGGCNTWNHHPEQANYAWRVTVALRVAAGLNK
jgi:murein DD-endopeptidase MepM/ murein hydrolase activator NlpD